MGGVRPRIAILGRFAQSVSCLRHPGVVVSRTIMESVWRAGAEPLMLLPTQDADGLDWSQRLAGFHGVLMPGGADLNPARYTDEPVHPDVYDIDDLQDAADLSLIGWAREQPFPLLAICRGFQVLNVAMGGTLQQHFEPAHQHTTHDVAITAAHDLLGIAAEAATVSCHHHQRIARVADGLTVVARAGDGTVEAVVGTQEPNIVGVQWHPEDTSAADSSQQQLFDSFVQRLLAAV